MSQPDNLPFQMFDAPVVKPDPGASGIITIDRSPCLVNLVSAAAETRTLDRPTKEGATAILHMQTDGGDITVTVTGGLNEDGDTTFVFSDPGQIAVFVSFATNAGVYFWRKISDYGLGNIAPGDAAILSAFSGLTATVAEINQAADESANIETVAATRVLVAADSGKTLILSHATEFDTALPAPAVGLRFHFIIGAAPSGANYTITTNGTTQNVIYGSVSSSDLDAAGDAALTNATAVDVVTFVASKAKIGDWVEVVCDGTNWFLRGHCQVFDAITLA